MCHNRLRTVMRSFDEFSVSNILGSSEFVCKNSLKVCARKNEITHSKASKKKTKQNNCYFLIEKIYRTFVIKL